MNIQDKRNSARWLSGALTLACGLLLMARCEAPTDSLTLTIVKAFDNNTDDPDPLQDVTTLRIQVWNDAYSEMMEPLEFNPFDGSTNFSSLLPRTGTIRIQAEGLTSSNSVVARGGSAFVTLGDGDLEVALFMGRVGTFHETMLPDRQPSELPFTLAGHTMTRLPNGQILILGGATLDSGGGITDISNRVIVYNPNDGRFSELPTQLRIRRAFHTATLLKAATAGGPQQVLVTGGISLISSERLESTRLGEIFDPVSMSFTGRLVEMTEARYGHTATLLVSGDVLVAGGAALAPQQLVANRPSPDDLVVDHIHADADLFQFSTTPQAFAGAALPMQEARMFQVAGRGGGKLVVIAGGENGSTVLQSTELYNPDSRIFESGTDLAVARTHATMTRLGNNDLLIVGGLTGRNNPQTATARVERFVIDDQGPGSAEEVDVQSRLKTPRWRHHAVLMSDNQQLLISGGLNNNGFTLGSAELIVDGSPTDEPLTMSYGRVFHASVRLLSGEVLLLGGVSLSASGGAEALLRGTLYTPTLTGD